MHSEWRPTALAAGAAGSIDAASVPSGTMAAAHPTGCSMSPLLCADDEGEALKATWAFAVLANVLKMVGIAQVTGVVRVMTGSFAAKEDYDLFRVTYGDTAPQDVAEPLLLRRLRAIHRNELETVPIFCALAYAYTLTQPKLNEARILFLVFTGFRLLHTLLYACASTPGRSVAWGVATQCLLIMAGKIAAWLLPAASPGLQILINAPLAVQWFISLGVLGSVWEQSRRHERYERRAGRVRGERRALVAGGASEDEDADAGGATAGVEQDDSDEVTLASKDARVRRPGVTRVLAAV